MHKLHLLLLRSERTTVGPCVVAVDAVELFVLFMRSIATTRNENETTKLYITSNL